MQHSTHKEGAGYGIISEHRGFSLLEVCVAIFILGIAIVPMLFAFSPAITATGNEEEMMIFTNRARKTLNRVAGLSYTTLDSNQNDPVSLPDLFGSTTEALKENFTLKDTSYTPIVAIIDASGGAGGLLQVRVTIDHVTLTTLKAEY